MLRKSLIFISFIFAFALAASAGGGGSKTYYSKLTVKTSDEKKGKVYVSTKSTNSPAYDTWASADNSGDDKQTYYLYAQPAEGLVLDYWSTNENGSGRTVEGTATTYAVSATSEDQNNPTTVTLYAFFKDTPPVSISVNDDVIGAVTFSNPANNVLNKSLTIVASYKMPAKWTNTEGFNVTSKSVKFDGWFKKDTKECVSTDLRYTFTVTEPIDLEARFSFKQFITSNDGYYRVKCSFNSYSTNAVFPIGSEKYLNIRGNYDWSFSSGRDVTPDIHYSNNKYSDPSNVLRITGTNYTPLDENSYKSQQTILKNVNLAGQGSSTYEATGQHFEIRSTEQRGLYKLFFNSTVLYNGYEGTDNPIGALTISGNYSDGREAMRSFDFLPISEEYIDEYYFAAEPDASMYEDGGYWTTMYTSFPYQCWDDGVEAYYISSFKSSGNETVAIMTKIEDGIVPAYTPVLLKCRDTDPSGNRLLPLLDDYEALEGNLLHGEFQLNGKVKDSKGKDTTVEREKVKFDGSKMRVLGANTNGEVGFYKLAEGTELAANKAWLDISSLTPAQASRIVLRPNDTTGIQDVVVEEDKNVNATIYNLMGQPVKELVPGQIYFRNGKKFIAR